MAALGPQIAPSGIHPRIDGAAGLIPGVNKAENFIPDDSSVMPRNRFPRMQSYVINFLVEAPNM
eukprot:1161973-Pelagomonas_calceolata.AAC.4